MPMRLSGLMSGMDTESIVAQLVETRKAKVTKAVKAQKSIKYKQDAWKSLNTKILNLYNKSLNNMRFESSFIKKTTKVSNSSVVSVITGENAMNSVQNLKVDKLAKTGILTGGEIKLADGTEVTGNTTLGDLGLIAGESANMEVSFGDGRDKERISVTANMTINTFVASLREAGLTANFDENNGRIFIASKQSGKEQDFDISATNVAGMEVLSALKLNYQTTPAFSATEMERSTKARMQSLLDNYNMARDAQKQLPDTLLKYGDKINEILAVKNNDPSFNVASYFNGTTTITEDQLKDLDFAIDALVKEAKDSGKNPNLVKDLEGWTSSWKKNENLIKDTEAKYGSYIVPGSDGKAAWDTAAVVDGMTIEQKVAADLAQKVTDLNAAVANPASPEEAPHKQGGEDAQITLNGVAYYSSRNTFEVNGLTLTVNALTKDGEDVTITTEDDVSGIYDMVKNFIKEYSSLINEMDKLYNADSAKGYDPLTDEEKEAMSDSAIEEWEKKITDSVLRKDSTLGTFASTMKQIMMEGVEVNGKKMYLSNFGINTLNYFSAADNEKNAYHIDGDPDDESTSGNPDKLKSMIANDPDTVVSFFTQLSKNLYDEMFDMMKGKEGISSTMTAYEDKKMQSDYDDYTVKIKELEKKLAEYEDKWYAKFAAMETALAKMQNNASAVTSLLGG